MKQFVRYKLTPSGLNGWSMILQESDDCIKWNDAKNSVMEKSKNLSVIKSFKNKLFRSYGTPIYLEKSLVRDLSYIWAHDVFRIQKAKTARLLEYAFLKEERYQSKVRKFMKQMEGRK